MVPWGCFNFVKSSFIYPFDVVSITKLKLFFKTFFYVLENKFVWREREKVLWFEIWHCESKKVENRKGSFQKSLASFHLLTVRNVHCTVNEKMIDMLQLFNVANLMTEIKWYVFYTLDSFLQIIRTTLFLQNCGDKILTGINATIGHTHSISNTLGNPIRKNWCGIPTCILRNAGETGKWTVFSVLFSFDFSLLFHSFHRRSRSLRYPPIHASCR